MFPTTPLFYTSIETQHGIIFQAHDSNNESLHFLNNNYTFPVIVQSSVDTHTSIDYSLRWESHKQYMPRSRSSFFTHITKHPSIRIPSSTHISTEFQHPPFVYNQSSINFPIEDQYLVPTYQKCNGCLDGESPGADIAEVHRYRLYIHSCGPADVCLLVGH